MKWLCVSIVVLLCGAALAANIPLRAKECSVGPSFWCQNITTAKSCGAVKHCIQTVWEHQTLPDDNDDVCKICKDMVAQARDQLESNETQEELKEVFEGSCKLILLKPVVKECMKLADQFISELVETLASQMNPGVVCSVAGLCNSVRIDNMLAAKEGIVAVIPATDLTSSKVASTNVVSADCSDCKIVAVEMRKKFDSTSRDDFLNNLVEVCGRFGSFSDGCSAAVITHFNSLYTHLREYMTPDQVCHLAGTCDAMFHTHDTEPKVEVTHESSIGQVTHKDDLPCDLCERLVSHLKDILVANTTEGEFQEVLQGLCKQTGSFKDECLSIVNQYYGMIYNYLVKALVPSETCALAGLCPQPGKKLGSTPIWPLVPLKAVNKFKAIKLVPAQKVIQATRLEPAQFLHRVNIGENGARVHAVQPAQLPIERMMPQAMFVANKPVCTFCEYFLHYLQQAITDPSSEASIKEAVENACDHLPTAIESQCREFVETYGDAFVALLAQEIDPSLVCPQLGLCPTLTIVDIHKPPVNDKASCPLCLFAVQELVTKLQDNKTEETIKAALNNLCTHLPKSLIADCEAFVSMYEEQLVDMLIADFTPQEVCVYLRLCDDKSITTTVATDILSNEIPQMPNALSTKLSDSTECIICEFVLSKLDGMLKNKTTEDEIKNMVHTVCNKLPITVGKECNDFVYQYADVVITLLAEELDPKQVCAEIKLCSATKFYKKKHFTKTIEECMVCEATLGALEGLLDDPTVEKEVGEKLSQACAMLPSGKQDQCRQMVQIYGPSIVNLVMQLFGGRMVCQKIGLCEAYVQNQKVELLGGKKCTWGPSYWCQSAHHAESCGATKHCIEKVWKAQKPK